LPLIAFLGAAALSTAFAINRNLAIFGSYDRWEGLLTIVSYALLFWLAVQTLSGQSDARGLTWSLLAGGYCVGAVAILQSGFGVLGGGYFRDPSGVIRADVTLAHPDFAGIFLAMLLPVALAKVVSRRPLATRVLSANIAIVIGLGLLLSFSRGAWINLGVAVAIFGVLHILTVRSNRARLRFAVLAVMGVVALSALVVGALQLDGVSRLASERATLDQSYDEGPDGRFGGQQKAIGLILQNPLGLGAQQFVPQYHHEEPHNVYITMFLNAGWVGGLIFLALVGTTSVWGLRHAFVRCATQPLFLVVYACFVANVLEGLIIDLDHWRHFYLLMALVWGLMLSGNSTAEAAWRSSGAAARARNR